MAAPLQPTPGEVPPRRGGRRARAAACLLLLAGGASPTAAWSGTFCRDPALDRDVVMAAHDELPPDRLGALRSRLDDPAADCDSKVAYCVGQKLALGQVDRAYVQLGLPAPNVAGAQAILTGGRKFGAPWQLLVALGDADAALARQDATPELYREAAGDLQQALNAINEPPLCAAFGEVRPEAADIRRIEKRAQEAVMLSPRFEVTRTRSGECGGIFLSAVRGIGVEATPVPITFVYGKADLTPEGHKAADALLQCLKEKGLPAVTLTGHTDQHGSDSYNMALSADRLAAVQALLRSGGYGGTLRLIPMGRREPFRPDDPAQHSADELDQMNRRVELREAAP